MNWLPFPCTAGRVLPAVSVGQSRMDSAEWSYTIEMSYGSIYLVVACIYSLDFLHVAARRSFHGQVSARLAANNNSFAQINFLDMVWVQSCIVLVDRDKN